MSAQGPLADLHAHACTACIANCSSLHRYTAAQCPAGPCDPCKALEGLDIEILDLEARLAKCSQQRRDLKTAINGHHDPLQRFPFEITTQIFNCIIEENFSYCVGSHSKPYRGNPALTLATVCKKWREVTFNVPMLWSKLTIDLWKLASNDYLNIIKKSVARSALAPLYLRVYAPNPPTIPEVPGQPHTVDVRKQGQAIKRFLTIFDPRCGRWKGLHLDSTTDTIRALFNAFKHYPELDVLQVDTEVDLSRPTPNVPITVPRELSSKVLRVSGHSFLSNVPLRCNRITDLDASMIGVNELMYVVKNAPNLKTLRMDDINNFNSLQYFPMPSARFQCKSLTLVDGKTSMYPAVLRLLTVPALQTLTHTFLSANVESDGFFDCLYRSKFENLTHLFLGFNTMEPRTPYMDGEGWYDSIPSLTHFGVKIHNIICHSDKDVLDIVKALTSPLDSHRHPVAFPLLQDFDISAPMYSKESWSLIYNMVRPGGIDGMTRVRPLQRVAARALSGYSREAEEMRNEARLGFLREIEQYGMELDFRVKGKPINLRDDNNYLSWVRLRPKTNEEERNDAITSLIPMEVEP